MSVNAKNESARSPDDDILDIYISRIANNDKDALAELYYKTRESVYGFALSILKNMQDAEDVLHDTYLRIFICCRVQKYGKAPGLDLNDHSKSMPDEAS